MLLSMFISFLLARRFSRRIYVPLMVVVMILISTSSVGWITMLDEHRINVEPQCTPPLSFPFHTIKMVQTWWRGGFPVYSIRFLELQISEIVSENYWFLTLRQVLLIHTFFLLVNIVGAILGWGISAIFGHWINKTTFIGRYFARRKTEEKELVDDVV